MFLSALSLPTKINELRALGTSVARDDTLEADPPCSDRAESIDGVEKAQSKELRTKQVVRQVARNRTQPHPLLISSQSTNFTQFAFCLTGCPSVLDGP